MRGTCPEVKIIIMRITEKGDVEPGAKKKIKKKNKEQAKKHFPREGEKKQGKQD